MRYISTRGQSPALAFEDVMLTGLAPDGGLYVPETLPRFSAGQMRAWAKLDYADLAATIEAVDFGNRAGTIFMVPAGDQSTPVVWLVDEAPSGRMEPL